MVEIPAELSEPEVLSRTLVVKCQLTELSLLLQEICPDESLVLFLKGVRSKFEQSSKGQDLEVETQASGINRLTESKNGHRTLVEQLDQLRIVFSNNNTENSQVKYETNISMGKIRVDYQAEVVPHISMFF